MISKKINLTFKYQKIYHASIKYFFSPILSNV